MRALAIAVLSLLAVGVAQARAPVGLAPGHWQLVTSKRTAGTRPTFTVLAHWPTQAVAQTIAFPPQPPIPRRMAYVVTESPRQPVTIRWTSFCYPNHEHSYPHAGTARGTGSVVGYPVLYPGRVQCDLYLYVSLHGRGSMRASIYAY